MLMNLLMEFLQTSYIILKSCNFNQNLSIESNVFIMYVEQLDI